jgi:hypothetical protein
MTVNTLDVLPYGPNWGVDPLGAAPVLEKLPSLNQARAVRPLSQALDNLVSQDSITELPGVYEPGGALGAISDLDMVMMSLRRLGVEPAEGRPQLTFALAGLAMIAAEVDGGPKNGLRSTLDTYIFPRPLPSGERAMLSGLPSEAVFVDQLRRTFIGMQAADTAMGEVDLERAELEEFEWSLGLAQAATDDMFAANNTVQQAYRNPPNGPFARTHRPYFEPLMIGGTKRSAPSGDQSAFKEMEFMLRGVDGDMTPGGNAEFFGKFFEPNIDYTPAYRRANVEKFIDTNGGTSFFTYIHELPKGEKRSRLAVAYLGVVGAMRGFSRAHGGVVQRDFKLRPNPNGTGGGGYSVKEVLSLKDERDEHFSRASQDLAA